MFETGYRKTMLQQIVLSCLVAMGFLVILLTYYKPKIHLPDFGIQKETHNHSCPVILCAEEAKTQVSKQNCSSEQHITPPQRDTTKVQAAAVADEPHTIVLIWMWPFGYKFDLNCGMHNITGCQLTDDKSLYHKAHGVLFHHRDIHRDMSNMPTEPRPWFQKWVWSNMESPENSGIIPQLDQLFNLTCNYRLDSNIPVPYGKLVPQTSEDGSFQLPAKDKLVCWIVSNWNPRYKRVDFFNELKKHIKIDTYGRAFGKSVSKEDYWKIVSSCKFYLSFENSIYQDYITEKLYRPMSAGTVPVVLGPLRQNYQDHIPSDSFIHFNDFSTPKDLAERLLYLDQNNTEYMKYFNWRKRYQVYISAFGNSHACETCAYLQRNRGYQAFNNLNKWYWG